MLLFTGVTKNLSEQLVVVCLITLRAVDSFNERKL